MQVQLSMKLHASSTLKETAYKVNSQWNCMQVQLSKKLHASSTLNETACKFNSQWSCMQVWHKFNSQRLTTWSEFNVLKSFIKKWESFNMKIYIKYNNIRFTVFIIYYNVFIIT
jgi:hypothetical protein